MNATDVANQYFAAWNGHDAEALLNAFAQEGTYRDPTTNGNIEGAAIAANAQALWSAFPDLSFDIVSISDVRSGYVAAEWLMTGTNEGEFRGLPATGNKLSLPGADFIGVKGDKVRSVTGYFDTHVIPEQLGLQVVIQPKAIGPFMFGLSTSAQTGKRTKPGAFSITQIMNASDDEVLETRDRTRNIATDMMHMEGFIGLLTTRIGGRGVTIAAWEHPNHVKGFMQNKAHRQAMERFFSGCLAESAYTSVWSPDHINATWVRCSACRKIGEIEKNAGVCSCGERLPEPAPYW